MVSHGVLGGAGFGHSQYGPTSSPMFYVFARGAKGLHISGFDFGQRETTKKSQIGKWQVRGPSALSSPLWMVLKSSTATSATTAAAT